MIDVSQKYKDAITAGLRNFNAHIEITLNNGTVLPTITNANLRSFSIDDAVSDDNKFTMLGSVIINQCVFTLNDMHDIYYNYDFFDAEVLVYIDCALLDGTIERIRRGTYFVADYRYLDGVIELTCYDYLANFDKPYSLSALEYPTSVKSIVEDACRICKVELSDKVINNQDLMIPNAPMNEETTFREVLSWIGQIIGCYARCNPYGELELTWCDVDTLNASFGSLDGGTFDLDTPYSSGDTADGGLFNPWNVGYVIASASFLAQGEAHNLYYNFSQEVAVVDTLITGVSISTTPTLITDTQYKLGLTIKNGRLILQASDDAPASFEINDDGELIVTSYIADDSFYIKRIEEGEDSEDSDSTDDQEGSLIMTTSAQLELDEEDTETKTFSVGQPGFVISIADNELLNANLASSVITQLGKQLIGMRFRKATTNHMNDPSIESGDIAILWDRKNRSYPIIITHTTFKIGGQQHSVCGSETSASNTASRQSETSRTINTVTNTVQTSIESMTNKLESFPGLYNSMQTIDGIETYSIYDKVSMNSSSIIWKMGPQAIYVSRDGGVTWNVGISLRRKVGIDTLSSDGTCQIAFTSPYTQWPELEPPNFNNQSDPTYAVFLQPIGQGNLWITKIASNYFVVKGTPKLQFCWKIEW